MAGTRRSMLDKADDLYAYLLIQMEPVTMADMADHLDLTYVETQRVIRHLRLNLGATEDANIVNQPAGPGMPHLYRLEHSADAAIDWAQVRMADIESRAKTAQAVLRSAVAASDGRKPDGRKARFYLKHTSRLVEDLADLRAGTSV